MAVGAQKRLAALAEALEMHLMAYTVAGTREHDALRCGDGLQIAMVVRVLETDLYGIVVHIADRKLVAHPLKSDRFELEIRHRARGVLRERLVYPDSDGRARLHASFHEMGAKHLVCDVPGHMSSWAAEPTVMVRF